MEIPIALEGAPLGLAVALGIGLLIGVERERRKGRGHDRRAAGVRSFALACATGALAQLLPVPGLVPAGAVLVALLASVSHWKSRSRDPGMTTELALFATYLIGVQAALSPAFGAACGAALAALLAARDRLHRFATRWLSEQELHDGLLLAALALIVLPLVPSGPVPWLAGIDPRPLAAMALLILALQAAGHVARRALGAQGGALAAGFFSGFVSSTATIASLGGRVRAQPDAGPTLAAGAALSTVATWVQALLMAGTLAPGALGLVLPVCAAGAAGGLAAALLPLRGVARSALPPDAPGSALRPREALLVALTLAVVALAVGSAQHRFGSAGLLASVALAAVVDAHAPVASLASLHSGGAVDRGMLVTGMLVVIGANSISRAVVAAIAGGAGFALRVAAALAAGLGLAATAAWALA